MKKKHIAALIFMLLCFGIRAAAAVPIDFHKYGGGQFIYCNNPEFIREGDLSTDENPSPSYIMKNERLGADNYSVFFCHYNWTGFDVEPDIEFTSDEGAIITINSVGYYIPQEYDYWDCVGVWSDLWGINIRSSNNYQQYVPYKKIDLPKTFTLKAGESGWISEYIYNYEPVAPKVTFNMLVDFTIESGEADVNFAALKNYGTVGDRSHHVKNAAPGQYKNDTAIKGIETESLPIVEADMDIEITPDTPDGAAVPVEVRNQYFPDGNIADFWMTNINPSRDSYRFVKETAANDMLTFTYRDSTKLGYYGSAVPERDKTDEWVFDIYHYNTTEYGGSMPWKAEEHIPNAPLAEELDADNPPDTNLQFNLGNFGVTDRYNLKITNTDTAPRVLNYVINATYASNIIRVYDENGALLNPYTLTDEEPFALSKTSTPEKTRECMLSIPVPAGETVKYTVDVTLPTNCYGGIENSLVVDSYKYLENTDFVDFPIYDNFYHYKNSFFGGEYQMRWEDGVLYRYMNGRWQRARLPQSAENVFDGRARDMQIVKYSSGYAARFKAWDEYGWSIADPSQSNKVYLFDNSFNFVKTVEFNGFVSNLAVAKDKKTRVFAECGGKTYILGDDNEFTEDKSGYGLPRFATGGAIFKKDGGFYMPNGENMSKIAFESRVPDEIYSAGGIFYRYLSRKNYDSDTETGNVLAVSLDGVNWKELYLPNRLIKFRNMEYIDNTLYIYTKYETFKFDDVFPANSIRVKLKGEWLAFDVSAKIINSRTMVPLRFFFEKLGAKVDWEDSTREITVTDKNTVIKLRIDDVTAYVNGEAVTIDTPPVIDSDKTLIPARFLSESLGYNVDWSDKERVASID